VGQVADIVFQATLSVRRLRQKYRAGQIAADMDGGALAFRLQLMADELAKAAREIEVAGIAAARKGSKTT
jgi:hypothetical protein